MACHEHDERPVPNRGYWSTFFYFGEHLETDAHRRTQSHDLNPAHTPTPEKKRTQHTAQQKALSAAPSMSDMSSFDTPVVGSTNPPSSWIVQLSTTCRRSKSVRKLFYSVGTRPRVQTFKYFKSKERTVSSSLTS